MHTNPVTRQREPINPLPGYVVDTPRNRASVGKRRLHKLNLQLQK